MRNHLQEYFYYTRMERNGLLVLISITLFCFALPFIWAQWLPTSQVDFSDFQSEIAAFQPTFQDENTQQKPVFASKMDSKTPAIAIEMFHFDPNTASKTVLTKLGLTDKTAYNIINYREKISPFSKVEDLKKIYTLKEADYERLKDYVQIANLPQTAMKFEKKEKTKTAITANVLNPFYFNPNTITASELSKLGLSKKVIKTMLNFRDKGGTFRKPEDLSKIYGLSTSIFQQLKPYIQLDVDVSSDVPEPIYAHQESNVPSAYSVALNLSIDINQSTVEEWQELRGIGPYFSKKIVGFRDKLGGFSSIAQVADTYNLPDSTFQQIKPSLKLSPIFKKINVNTNDAETLAKHPYISNKLARAIVNYRKQHGDFQNIEAFQKMRILKKSDAEKLKPYLEF